MASLMRAVRFHKIGDINNLTVDLIPLPIRQPNELLIKINASAVNPSDYKNVEGLFPFTTTPRVPGRDFC
ncbi:5768_t:CDS:2, partial [Paraglomus brasilianum]